MAYRTWKTGGREASGRLLLCVQGTQDGELDWLSSGGDGGEAERCKTTSRGALNLIPGTGPVSQPPLLPHTYAMVFCCAQGLTLTGWPCFNTTPIIHTHIHMQWAE